MTSFPGANFNFYGDNVTFIFRNPDAKNTSSFNYSYTMPNSQKCKTKNSNSDIKTMSREFSKGIRDYTRSMISSVFGRINDRINDRMNNNYDEDEDEDEDED